ncbi:hypothetical protein [Acetonema longum]|uniref:Uncharacterized protein n=1 Tax=Acetonema longum DSM 6540 TaxID=1009370 RepID=F7NN06_9FIRM|nr:hypothetical protein [Acetonema longum]EGO62584.1 hypothetical protein ALO_17446 [Acetonema longum DSM 6540]
MKQGNTSSNAQVLINLAESLALVESLEADFLNAHNDLGSHVRKVIDRILMEKSKYDQKVRALSVEKSELMKQIKDEQEKASDFIRIGYRGKIPEPNTKPLEKRLEEIREEQEAITRMMDSPRPLPDEEREFHRLYSIAEEKRAPAKQAAEALCSQVQAAVKIINERFIPDGIRSRTEFKYRNLLSATSRYFAEMTGGF